MTVHYELKLERQARSLVSSQNRAGGFNCQEQGHGVEFQGPHHGVSLAKSKELRCPHCRPRFALYCTYWSSKLQLTRANSTSTRLLDLPHLLLRKPKKIPRLAFSCYRHLNSRKPHTTLHLCERTTFTKIINKNNEIAINTKEQTAVHHSNRPVELASMNI